MATAEGTGDPPEVLLLVVDAGGGHRSASRALLAAAEEKQVPWRFRVESLETLLGSLDFLRKGTGLSLEEGYNLILRRRWTALLTPLLRLLHGLIALRRRALVRELRRQLAGRRPAAVLSVIPNFNGIVRDALAAEHPGVPLLVLLTDFADFPPRFWIEPDLSRVIVATDEAARQALTIGIPPERISRVSGMVLHPRFYGTWRTEARARVRRELGFPADAFTVMLLFGGKGSPEMEPLAARLLQADWRVIAVCGDNPDLVAKLGTIAARGGKGHLHLVGFTDRVADFMAASDLLVTKPGPGSLAEAFHQGVPVVVTRNRDTIPQERFNTRFVEEHGLGLVVGHWKEIPGAVAALARDPARRARLQAAIAALPENRAVYEAVEIVGSAVAERGSVALG